ncbi:hypothetical protein WA026_009033 [Henosepilachna vigintioctopunctata]|uniref:Uncharacterized protein n=1 Tax=Henosepilachna vigintioctopunctata TaxID=420089 RepID=A0AAW1UZ06_9CUCU
MQMRIIRVNSAEIDPNLIISERGTPSFEYNHYELLSRFYGIMFEVPYFDSNNTVSASPSSHENGLYSQLAEDHFKQAAQETLETCEGDTAL